MELEQIKDFLDSIEDIACGKIIEVHIDLTLEDESELNFSFRNKED